MAKRVKNRQSKVKQNVACMAACPNQSQHQKDQAPTQLGHFGAGNVSETGTSCHETLPRKNYATLPPAASRAALAPAVTPIPESLTADLISPLLISLTVLII